MNHYKLLTIVFLFLIGWARDAHAQDDVRRGRLQDTARQSVVGATILWMQLDQGDSGKLVTGIDGKWAIVAALGNYRLKISHVGFRTIDTIVQMQRDARELLFTLWPADGMLEEVRLEAQRVQIKEDTVTYLVDSTMYRKNDKVEDVLKNLPGVQVDRDGTVTAQGKQVTRVKVNGKEFFNGDVTTATKELYADMVDRIQIIDDYGDQTAFTGVRDGDPTKTMNIQLRKDKNKGYFGNLTAGGGSEDRFLGKTSINRFNNEQQISLLGTFNNINESSLNLGNGGGGGGMGGMMAGMARSMGLGRGGAGAASGVGGQGTNSDGITETKAAGINYRDEWGERVSVYGSYSISDRETEVLQSTSQQTLIDKQTLDFRQTARSNRENLNHRFSFNLEFKADSFNYLKINPSVRINHSESVSNAGFVNYSGDVLRSTGNQDQLSQSNTIDWGANLLFNHKFKKRGRTFSLQGNIGETSLDGVDNVLNFNNLFIQSSTIVLRQAQEIAQDNENNNQTIRLSYTEPITSKRNLEINYSLIHQQQGNDRGVGILDSLSGNYTANDSLSNNYLNDYWAHRVGLNLRTTEKKYNYSIGFGVQPARMETRSIAPVNALFMNQLVNIFPVVRFAYNFSKSKSLNFNYNGANNQPTNAQLQPVADRSNLQFISIGNPDLKPEFTHTFSMRYNRFDMISGNVFFGNLTASFTQDKIVNSTRLLRGGAQEIRYLNSNGFYTVAGFYNISKPIMNRTFVFNLGGNMLFNNQLAFLEDSSRVQNKNIGKNWVLGQRFSTDIKVKKWLEMTWSVNWSLNDLSNSYQKNLDASVIGWTFSHYGRIFLPKDFILNYEMDRSLNIGFSSTTLANPFIIQASLEKQVLKDRNLSLKLQVFDVLNQNIGVSRSVNANGFTDTRTNRLGRFVMLTATYRLNKFGVSSKQASSNTPFMPGGGGEYKMRMPGGGGF
jgi:hypothetical protein